MLVAKNQLNKEAHSSNAKYVLSTKNNKLFTHFSVYTTTIFLEAL